MANVRYDKTTQDYIQMAKTRVAENHGIILNEDPKDVMKRNNAKLHEAAVNESRKKGMVRQTVGSTVKPLQHNEYTRINQPDPKNDSEYDRMMSKLLVESDPSMEMEYTADYSDDEPVIESVQDDGNELSNTEDSGELYDYANNINQVQEPIVPKKVIKPNPSKKELPKKNVSAPSKPMPQMVQQTNYESFTDIRGLPSQGAMYSNQLVGQAFKLGDLLDLGDIDDQNIVDKLTEVLGRRIKGAKPEEILTADEVFLLHWLRASSFPDINLDMVEFKCPSCNTVIDSEDDLGGISLNFSNLSFNVQGDINEILSLYSNEYGCHSIMLPDQRQCDVYLRRRSHVIEVEDYLKGWRKFHKKAVPSSIDLLARIAVVIEIQGCEGITEKIEYLQNLPASQATQIIKQISAASLNTVVTANIICPHCGKEVTVEYPFRLDKFLPKI